MGSTELLFLSNAYIAEFDAEVIAAQDSAVALSATAFFATGGGQPHDTGTLTSGGNESAVVDVIKNDGMYWDVLADEGVLHSKGDLVHGRIDWERRYLLMRTHTALHILNGIIWRGYQAQ